MAMVIFDFGIVAQNRLFFLVSHEEICKIVCKIHTVFHGLLRKRIHLDNDDLEQESARKQPKTKDCITLLD
jgi:hypothetical protein